MRIDLNRRNIEAAITRFQQWMLQYGGVPGDLAGQLAVEKLLSRFGEGIYEVKERGKLYKGNEMVVHRDDVKEFVMGKEVELKKAKDLKEVKEEEIKEVKEVKEDKAPVGGKGADRRRARKRSNPWAK